jgi:hypothetical protein
MTDMRAMEVSCGNMTARATPQHSMKKWYEVIHPTTAAEIIVHEHIWLIVKFQSTEWT